MTLDELARKLGAELHPGTADPQAANTITLGTVPVIGVAGLEAAGPYEISFLDNRRYAAAAQRTRAAAVLVEPSAAALPVPTLRVEQPYLAFAHAVELFYQPPIYPPGVHLTAVIDPTAELGEGIHVGPYVVIGPGVRIGRDSVLLAHTVLYAGVTTGARFFAHAHAIVRESCILGDDVVLGNSVTIGSDGFGFVKNEAGAWHKIPQSGRVVIGDRVEIQAGSCIDRASVGETVIAAGTKIDNLVQVGHGSTVGEHTLLCSQVGLAGSSHIGSNVILAGQVGVAGHLHVGDGVIATAQSGIPGDVTAKEMVSGYPAIANRKWLRASAVFVRLPEVLRRLTRLEHLLAQPEKSVHRD